MRRPPRQVSRLPPALASRGALEPDEHPPELHRRGSEQWLEVRARPAAVAPLAHSQAPDALREAARDARPERILLFALWGLLALAGGLHRLMVRLGADGELAWRLFGCGTDVTGGTGATGGLGQTAPQHRSAGDIVAWGPLDPRMSLGTAGLVGVPIHHKGLQVIALGHLVWPTLRSKGRADHIDLGLLRSHQDIGIDVAAVASMGTREQVSGGSSLEAGRSQRTIGRG
jgi:hypothetical protein